MHDLYKQSNLPYLNVKICPNCNEMVSLDQEFCPHCKYNFTLKEITNKEEKKENDNLAFQEINQYVKNNDIYPPTTNQSSLQLEKNDPLEEIQKENSLKNDELVMFCEKCGSKIIGTQRYCGGCGAKVSKRICPSCKQIVDSSLAFCTYCGEKLIQNNSAGNVQPSLEEVNSQIIQYNLDSKNNEQTPESSETLEMKTVQIPTKETSKNLIEDEEENFNEEVNMGKKRFIIIVQMLVATFIFIIMIMVPILTKESLFTSLIACFKGDSKESILAGKDFIQFFIQAIKDKSFDLNLIKNGLTGENDALIFSGISFIANFLNLFSNPDIGLYVSFFVVSLVYILIFIAMLILYISSFIGLFNKKPFKGKACGFLTITLALGCILIFSNSFTKGFLKYDSWLVCAFFLTFILWMIIKINNLVLKKKKKKQNS